jgi:hypothetical protein
VTCFVELSGNGIGDVNAEPPPGVALPAHNADNTAGPPPPPPYTGLAATPSKGYGYVALDGTLVTYTCFANIGSTPYNANALGPNLIAKTVIPHFYQQLHALGEARVVPGVAGNGFFIGTGFSKKSSAECDAVAAGTFFGKSDTTGSPITFYPANDADPRCVGVCVKAPWRVAGNVLHGYPNWDGDNCTDAQELFSGKPGLSTKGCGDDPWSPLDSVTVNSADDIAGIYGIEVTLARQDITGGTTIVPGHYITCTAYIQKGMSGGATSVEARLLCNHDSPTEAVNPDYGGKSCPAPLPANMCSDGSPGAAPPGCNDTPANCQAASPDTAHGGTCQDAGRPSLPPCFDLSDLNTVQWLFPPVGKPNDTYPQPTARQTALSGTISGNTLTLAGCFRDYNNTAVDGYSYWQLKANVHTGVGVVNIWRNLSLVRQALGNCLPLTASPPGIAPGGVPDYAAKEVQLTRETADTCSATNNAVCQPITLAACPATTAPCGYNTAKWDSDGDTCPDAWELSDVTNVPFRKAGLRDPSNRWDYMDVNHDGLQDVSDILDAAQKYFVDKGNTTDGAGGPDNLPAGYMIETDRTGLAGSEDWELNSPDGYVDINEVVDSLDSYFHTCPPNYQLGDTIPPPYQPGDPIPLPAPNAG